MSILQPTFEDAVCGKYLDVIQKRRYDPIDVWYLLYWHKHGKDPTKDEIDAIRNDIEHVRQAQLEAVRTPRN